MAVLVEAISVIVRRKAIDEKFLNGWEGFQRIVPNSSLCFDEELVRLGFMSPKDVQGFVAKLEEQGLIFLEDNKAVDIAVVDQQQGPMTECDWLAFIRLKINDSGDKVATCWLIPEKRIRAAGIHMPTNWQPGEKIMLETPPGWTFKNSLSKNFRFIKNENLDKEMIFIGHQDGLDVYLDRKTGKKFYEGRPFTKVAHQKNKKPNIVPKSRCGASKDRMERDRSYPTRKRRSNEDIKRSD